MQNREWNCLNLASSSILEKGDYTVYNYPFEVLEGIKFLAIHVKNLNALNYLSLFCTNINEEEQVEEYILFDLPYMKEFEVNKTTLSKAVSLNNLVVFQMEIDNDKVHSIKVKANGEESSVINIAIAGYFEKPKTVEEYENAIELVEPTKIDVKDEEKYLEYEYSYEKMDGISFICIVIFIEQKLDYLSIYVGPSDWNIL